MRASGNKLLVVFLGSSVIFFAAAMLVREDAPVGSDGVAGLDGASGGAPAQEGVGLSAEPAIGAAVIRQAVMDSAVNARVEATATLASVSGSAAANEHRSDLGRYDLDKPDRQFKLPNRLREVSGLAMLAGDRLLAHDDERGRVVEIDFPAGSIVKDFELGGPRGRVADDFEGIAAAEDRLYLVTSSGRLYEFAEGADGETVPYYRYETGVGRLHEIEGLAYDPDRRVLLLVSKNPRNARQLEQIVIYPWSIETRRLVDDGRIYIESSSLANLIDRKRFQPSGIERHPVSGNYFVVAARQHAVAEMTPQGTVLAAHRLKAGRHRQAEGITFASDDSMIIADEGAGKRATLSFYPVSKVR